MKPIHYVAKIQHGYIPSNDKTGSAGSKRYVRFMFSRQEQSLKKVEELKTARFFRKKELSGQSIKKTNGILFPFVPVMFQPKGMKNATLP